MKQAKQAGPEMKRVPPQSKWKVYGWRYYRSVGQTREIALAPSKGAVARALSLRGYSTADIDETGDEGEIALARSKPGTIFYCDNRLAHGVGHEYSEEKPKVAFDVPFPKPIKPVEVTLWVVARDGFGDDPVKLHSAKCIRGNAGYTYIKENGRRDAGGAFRYGNRIALGLYEEDPNDAIARYIRGQEDKIEGARKSIEKSERNLSAATMLYLKNPETTE